MHVTNTTYIFSRKFLVTGRNGITVNRKPLFEREPNTLDDGTRSMTQARPLWNIRSRPYTRAMATFLHERERDGSHDSSKTLECSNSS